MITCSPLTRCWMTEGTQLPTCSTPSHGSGVWLQGAAGPGAAAPCSSVTKGHVGTGVTVTPVLLGEFGKRSQLHCYAPQTGFYLSLHTTCPVPPERAPLCDTQPREGTVGVPGKQRIWVVGKDADLCSICSGIATPQFFWHPEPWFAWQCQLSLLTQNLEPIPLQSTGAVPCWISPRGDCPLWAGPQP